MTTAWALCKRNKWHVFQQFLTRPKFWPQTWDQKNGSGQKKMTRISSTRVLRCWSSRGKWGCAFRATCKCKKSDKWVSHRILENQIAEGSNILDGVGHYISSLNSSYNNWHPSHILYVLHTQNSLQDRHWALTIIIQKSTGLHRGILDHAGHNLVEIALESLAHDLANASENLLDSWLFGVGRTGISYEETGKFANFYGRLRESAEKLNRK